MANKNPDKATRMTQQKIVHAIEGTRYDEWDAHLPLQIAIVDTLAKTDKPLSKIEIADKLGKHRVNTPIGGLTRLLERQGLVARERDGVRLLYSLTHEGHKAAKDYSAIGKAPKTSGHVAESVSGAEDLRTVMSTNTKVVAATLRPYDVRQLAREASGKNQPIRVGIVKVIRDANGPILRDAIEVKLEMQGIAKRSNQGKNGDGSTRYAINGGTGLLCQLLGEDKEHQLQPIIQRERGTGGYRYTLTPFGKSLKSDKEIETACQGLADAMPVRSPEFAGDAAKAENAKVNNSPEIMAAAKAYEAGMHTVVAKGKKATATKEVQLLTGYCSRELRALPSENRNGVGSCSITALRRQGVGGMHCLQATVIASQPTLGFNGSRDVELTLHVLGEPDVLVELCDTRGEARLDVGSVFATVGEPFELFFRLVGTTDSRVLVELRHADGDTDVTPFVLNELFDVNAAPRQATPSRKLVKSLAPVPDWLLQFPEGGIRELFAHLAEHGVVTESEVAFMLGGQRELRRFARQFEDLVALSPFRVRIETVAGVKRYVREGI